MLSSKTSPRSPTPILQLELWPLDDSGPPWGCKIGLSLGRYGAARFLNWRADWELMGREAAWPRVKNRVSEDVHSCSPGSLPRVRRALSARPIQGKELSLPSHSGSTQN